MFIIGCDFHSRFQQISMLDKRTGEIVKRRLEHENGEAQKFYVGLPGPALVGMEATFNAQWFERMLGENHHELWIGDAAAIRAAMMRCLLTEAAQTASRFDPELRRNYERLKFRRGNSGVAKVAIARKLAVRLYWKLREAAQLVPPARMQGSPTSPMVEATPSRT